MYRLWKYVPHIQQAFFLFIPDVCTCIFCWHAEPSKDKLNGIPHIINHYLHLFWTLPQWLPHTDGHTSIPPHGGVPTGGAVCLALHHNPILTVDRNVKKIQPKYIKRETALFCCS